MTKNNERECKHNGSLECVFCGFIFSSLLDVASSKTPTEKPLKWEEEFDERFEGRISLSDGAITGSYAKDYLKSFISQLISTETQKARGEIVARVLKLQNDFIKTKKGDSKFEIELKAKFTEDINNLIKSKVIK